MHLCKLLDIHVSIVQDSSQDVDKFFLWYPPLVGGGERNTLYNGVETFS